MPEILTNGLQVSASAGYNNSVTSITVAYVSGGTGAIPSVTAPQTMRLYWDGELVEVTATSGVGNVNWTIVRGIESTLAISHLSSSVLIQILTQGGLQQFIADQLPSARGSTAITQMADSASIPTSGRLAAFDASGNVKDSGIFPFLSLTSIVTANWSTLNAGGTRADITTFPSGSGINIVAPATANKVYGVSTTVSAGDFTHFLTISYALSGSFGTGHDVVLAGFTDGTKVEGTGVSADQVGGVQNLTVSTLTSGAYGAANGLISNTFYPGPAGMLFVKLTRVGTTLSGYLSWDQGFTWVQQFNDTTPFLTASSIAVWSDYRGTSTANPAPRFTLLSYV